MATRVNFEMEVTALAPATWLFGIYTLLRRIKKFDCPFHEIETINNRGANNNPPLEHVDSPQWIPEMPELDEIPAARGILRSSTAVPRTQLAELRAPLPDINRRRLVMPSTTYSTASLVKIRPLPTNTMETCLGMLYALPP
jgi:hypothetical protein